MEPKSNSKLDALFETLEDIKHRDMDEPAEETLADALKHRPPKVNRVKGDLLEDALDFVKSQESNKSFSLLDSLESLPRAEVNDFSNLFDGFDKANDKLVHEYAKRTESIRSGDVHIEEEIELKKQKKTKKQKEREQDLLPFYKEELRGWAVKIKKYVEARNIAGGERLRRLVAKSVSKSEFVHHTDSARIIVRCSPSRKMDFYHGDISESSGNGHLSDEEVIHRAEMCMRGDLEMIVKKIMVWVE